MDDLPWCDLKVAFDCEDPEGLWAARESQNLNLPDGWELNETDSGGARCVAIFRVDVLPTTADGKAVLAILAALSTDRGGE